MKMTWRRINDSYYARPTGSDVDTLPLGVYRLAVDDDGIHKLDYVSDKLKLPSKLYTFNEEFVNRVISTWTYTESNLGVLLSGLKGTGKSVVASQLSNACGVPVIILDKNSGNPSEFISTYVRQDVCLFFDEFEKNFSEKRDCTDHKLAPILSLLDGLSSTDKKLFSIMTINNDYGMEYLLNRPGRIRYHRVFTSLPASVYTPIIDDLLKYPEFREDLLSTCKEVHNLSIDTVTTLIREVNLFRKPASELVEDMNILFTDYGYDFTFVQLDPKDVNTQTDFVTNIQNCYFEQSNEKLRAGACVYINSSYVGNYVESIAPNSFVVDIEADKILEFRLKSCFSKQDLRNDIVRGTYLVSFAKSTRTAYSTLRHDLHKVL